MTHNNMAPVEGHNPSQPATDYDTAADFYASIFSIHLARSSDDVSVSQALRYRVYCEETGFLPKDRNPGGLERDAFDLRSESILLTHKATGTCSGTVRVILPQANPDAGLLPALTCSEDMLALTKGSIPLETTGEISRFTIAPEFRRRAGDTLYQQVYDVDAPGADARRIIPYMALGLFTGILEVVKLHKLSHLCAVIDPPLLRILRRLHVHFHPVGDLVNYHGKRQPVIVSTQELYSRMQSLPDAYLRIVNRDGQLNLH
ncbi:MAG: PEP-CTERM/exosortase system-associated acyltransferase [Sphingomonadales bacterium]